MFPKETPRHRPAHEPGGGRRSMLIGAGVSKGEIAPQASNKLAVRAQQSETLPEGIFCHKSACAGIFLGCHRGSKGMRAARGTLHYCALPRPRSFLSNSRPQIEEYANAEYRHGR